MYFKILLKKKEATRFVQQEKSKGICGKAQREKLFIFVRIDLPVTSNMTAKLSPPLTPRSERADGQEFGLVPKYVLRKRKKTDSCTKGNDQVGPTMKDLQENDIPHKTPEQADKLFKETNSLLARRWRLSTLVDSDHDKKLLLETENFDPTAAANRIENNCRTKMELFGPELMDKKIALHGDLSSGKSEIGVEDGFVQLLATRDLGGRAVLFFQYDSNIYAKQSQNFRKTLYYMMASALEDSETVRRGMSLVVFNSDPAKWFDVSYLSVLYREYLCLMISDVPFSYTILMFQSHLSNQKHSITNIIRHFLIFIRRNKIDDWQHPRTKIMR